MDRQTQNTTRSAYIWTRILNTPFWAVYNMLPFIMYKDMHATLFQLWAVVSIKPFVSLFSMYWGDFVHKRPDLLRKNVIWGNIIGHVPFLFIPYFKDPWYLIFCSGFYMILARGVAPAWMEILKLNIPRGRREKVFAFASAFGYIGGGVLPFALGWIMDSYLHAWVWIFPITALISMSAIVIQATVPVPTSAITNPQRRDVLQKITRPWKNVFHLLRSRPDFSKYQLGFMLGGGGLIIMQPALQIFFVDSLSLSYIEMAVALTLCKGVGFGITFPLWSRWINSVDIYRFNSVVTLIAFIFPIGLILSLSNIAWLYAAYLCYGIMQAGSELSWNMSGPIFAKDEDSSIFTSTNLVTVGLRGSFVPLVGTLLCSISSPVAVMLVGGLLCLMATAWMSRMSSGETRFAAESNR